MNLQSSQGGNSNGPGFVSFANNLWVQLAALVIVVAIIIALAAKYIW